MYSVVQFVHSYWAYLVLIVLVIATVNALSKFFGKKEYGGKDMSLALFTLITMHIQLLIGLVLWFVSPNGLQAIKANGMGGLSSQARQLAVEHPFLMIIAVVLVTVGYSKHKKQRLSTPKFKKIAIFYTLALIAVLAIIPWSQWF
ncbi:MULTISPECIES: hypothetical protein [Dokdonia]|jgi:heme A synthase|uniref:50S ribosomal protein L27 n=1 Tax=Dokdonia donghaensis DSW-1 TaxID=1300343 RepID=A0A0A2GTR5_9FLAO|nr:MULTISPECIES: hypothetical protein [Dokdonia]ANH59276.1 hypothetical protein I597_0344 [Dokdonia donghaensis DSW-1]EAQ39375.1 hypothetical protein MED134_07791 [Dokdonia sp. MED134]KGO06684.1 hypothetical protein NV36_07385 [Dokdonia donghaensis DSW-1]MDE0598773.1 hypothetical protein [Dokdonia donghaensis]